MAENKATNNVLHVNENTLHSVKMFNSGKGILGYVNLDDGLIISREEEGGNLILMSVDRPDERVELGEHIVTPGQPETLELIIERKQKLILEVA